MLLPVIRKRRSVRKFQMSPISSEAIAAITEAGVRAPSSRGFRPWKFIVVDDPELLHTLAACKEHGSAFLAQAPLAIVVIADQERSDVWIEDTSIAATYMQLTIESLGLGSCWIQVRERMHDANLSAEEFIRRELHIPDRFKVACILAIGIPDETLTPHSLEKLIDGQVMFNAWQD